MEGKAGQVQECGKIENTDHLQTWTSHLEKSASYHSLQYSSFQFTLSNLSKGAKVIQLPLSLTLDPLTSMKCVLKISRDICTIYCLVYSLVISVVITYYRINLTQRRIRMYLLLSPRRLTQNIAT